MLKLCKRGKRTGILFGLGLFLSPVMGNVPYDSIPLELGADSRVYLQGTVNGGKPVRFLLDTGATGMVINPNSTEGKVEMKFDGTVTNVGATGSSEVKKSSSNSVALGQQKLEGVPFISIPYDPKLWDGVIGLWFFKRQVSEINFSKKMLYLYHHDSYTPPPNAIKLKIEYAMDLPVIPVQVTVNGKTYPLRLEVDTGSDRVLDLNTPFVKKHQLQGTQVPFAVSQITGSEQDVGVLENVIFDDIRIGKYCLPRIPGAFSTVKSGVQSSAEMDGVMGANLLKRFNIVCDFKAGYIYLIPNDLLYTPFYECLTGEKSSAEDKTKKPASS